MSEVRIPALVKINLRLEVIGKRSDGFHELRTIFQTISLQDELRLKSWAMRRFLTSRSKRTSCTGRYMRCNKN